jgi:hypothetical protein
MEKERKGFAQYLKGAEVHKGTTIFPSFTMSVIPTLDSGISVYENGMVGEYFPIRELGRVANIFSKFEEEEANFVYPKAYNVEKIAKRYKFAHITTEYVINTAYSNKTFNGLETKAHISFHDMVIQLTKMVKDGKYDFIYAYSDLFDHAQHTYTSASYEVEELLDNALGFMAKLLVPILKANGYNLIITSDHGHLDFNKDHIVPITPTGGIMDYLAMRPWGSPRALFFDVLGGEEKKFEDTFSKMYGSKALLIDSEEALRSGLFGNTHNANSAMRYRFGTHMAIAKDHAFFRYIKPGDNKKPKERFGHHSGMSKDEMEIPIIVY